jgi:hypothetical protein
LPRFEKAPLVRGKTNLDMIRDEEIAPGEAIPACHLEVDFESACAIDPGNAGMFDAPISGRIYFLKISGTFYRIESRSLVQD